MDAHEEEKLLWAQEMARSTRDFEQAVRAGLLPTFPDKLSAGTDSMLTRSRLLIATSESLLEACRQLREASAMERTRYRTFSSLSSLQAVRDGD